MKIEGRHKLPAPREQVWAALLDPDVIASTLPGCQELTRVDDHSYKARLKVAVGPVTGEFDGHFSISDLQPPESYKIKISGRGPSGFMDGSGEIQLTADNDETELHYDINAQVGGRVASVGQRLLDSTARVVTRQGLERLGQQVAALKDSKAQAPAPQGGSGFVFKTAAGVLVETVPPRMRPVVVVLGLLVLLAVIFWVVKAFV